MMIFLIGLGVLILIIYTIIIARIGYMSGVNDWELTKEVLQESGHLPKYVKNEKGYWVKEKCALHAKKVPTHKEFQEAVDKSGLRGYKFGDHAKSETKQDGGKK